MPASNHATPAGAAVFTMKSGQIFVLSSIFAASGAYLALQSLAWVFALGLALIFFLAAQISGGGKIGAVALALSFFAAFLLAQDRLGQRCPGPADLCQLRANVVSFSGTVMATKVKESDKGRLVVAEVSAEKLIFPFRKTLSGRVLVRVGPYLKSDQIMPCWGHTYIFSGRLSKPSARVFSFEFDEKRFLTLRGIYCQVSAPADNVQTVNNFADRQGANNAWNAALDLLEREAALLVSRTALLREAIVAAHIKVMGEERGKLLTSMVLGDRAVSLTDSIKDAFARVGLSHLLAASGLNLTIIVGAVLFVFSLTKKGRDKTKKDLFQALGALICVLFFVSLAGASPSVTRATIMCLLLLWSSLVFRRLATGAALAAALWISLLCDPLSVLDVGLELSYGATFGIIYFYPVFMQACPRFALKKPWHWFCAICAVVVSAQLAVLPVQMFCFQKMSTLVLPANMLAEPLVAPITVMGFFSSFVVALATLSNWAGHDFAFLFYLPLAINGLFAVSAGVDYFSGWLIDLLLALTKLLGSMPLSYLYMARPDAGSVVFYYLFLAMAFVQGLSRPRAGSLIAICSGFIMIGQGFLNSPALEILVDADRAVICRANGAVQLLQFLPQTDLAQHKSGHVQALKNKGSAYLPAYHRDFILAYIHSLRLKDQCTPTLVKSTNGQLWQDRELGEQLLQSEGGTVLKGTLPAAAIDVEEAQGVRLYKIKNWGLVWRWIINPDSDTR